MSPLQPWSTEAINLPDHADNLIHTDEGARAAGFERALVAGTTVYAYMTHPVVAAWGVEWLASGGGELRLRRPVFDGEQVDCTVNKIPTDDPDGGSERGDVTVTAEVGGEPRAGLEVWRSVDAPALRHGEALSPVEVVLDQTHLDYGQRAGDDLGLYAEQRIAHPVTWANLANTVFKENLVTGPWIHVRSRIFHEGVAPIGATIRAEAWLVERFDSRAGERALVDMRMYADGRPVVTVEHEAIIVLP